ncbi:MAG: SDR family oxidoreductase, partial [Marinicaulis sp.]|nr:SDR family oxidoreductase [Marinicaulis sp.]
RGQGAAEARLFADEGAKVFVADVLVDEGEAVVDEIKSRIGADAATFLSLDVTERVQWDAVVSAIGASAGRLNILVNNAGINRRTQLSQMTLEDWDRLLDVNLTGVMHGMQTCLKLLRAAGSGSIVNVGSLAGLMGHPTTGYSAAKFGLRGLTKSAALEFAPWGIRVNAMHPGLVKTPIIDPQSPAYRHMEKMTPLGRAGTAEELAEVALFLASDASSFITGIDVAVDGGFSELGAYSAVWRDAQAEKMT